MVSLSFRPSLHVFLVCVAATITLGQFAAPVHGTIFKIMKLITDLCRSLTVKDQWEYQEELDRAMRRPRALLDADGSVFSYIQIGSDGEVYVLGSKPKLMRFFVNVKNKLY